MAADNGAHQVVSGPLKRVDELERHLVADGVRVERLNTSHAFHSALMDPVSRQSGSVIGRSLVGAAFGAVGEATFTGRVVKPGQSLDGEYWRMHARGKVAFAEGGRCARRDRRGRLGRNRPAVRARSHGPVGLASGSRWRSRDRQRKAEAPVVLSSLRGRSGNRSAHGLEEFAEAAAGLYEAGVPLSFTGLFAGESRRQASLAQLSVPAATVLDRCADAAQASRCASSARRST